jgi:hypothetical protein
MDVNGRGHFGGGKINAVRQRASPPRGSSFASRFCWRPPNVEGRVGRPAGPGQRFAAVVIRGAIARKTMRIPPVQKATAVGVPAAYWLQALHETMLRRLRRVAFLTVNRSTQDHRQHDCPERYLTPHTVVPSLQFCGRQALRDLSRAMPSQRAGPGFTERAEASAMLPGRQRPARRLAPAVVVPWQVQQVAFLAMARRPEVLAGSLSRCEVPSRRRETGRR